MDNNNKNYQGGNFPPQKDYLFIPRMILCIAAIAVGVHLIATGLGKTNFFGNGDYVFRVRNYDESIEFGADFYTEVYQATAGAVANLGIIYYVLTDFADIFCIATGAGFVCGFGLKLFGIINNCIVCGKIRRQGMRENQQAVTQTGENSLTEGDVKN